jgi:hypothetical protein
MSGVSGAMADREGRSPESENQKVVKEKMEARELRKELLVRP